MAEYLDYPVAEALAAVIKLVVNFSDGTGAPLECGIICVIFADKLH